MSTTVTETETRARSNSLSLRGQQYDSDEDKLSQDSFSTVVEAKSEKNEEESSNQPASNQTAIQKNDQGIAKPTESSDTDEEEPSPCGRCRKMVVRGDEALMCEICSQWFHIKCEKITKAQYKNQASKAKNFHWYCDACDIVHSGIIREVTLLKVEYNKFKRRLEELEENKVNKEDLEKEMEKKADKDDVEKLEQRITTMEGKHAASGGSSIVNQGASCSKRPEDHAEELIKEIKDQEERKLNALLFNLPESKADNDVDRTKHDKDEVKQLAKHCKVVRLGKKHENKPRPLLIQISSDDKKRMLFKNLRMLQEAPDKFKQVSVKHDLTEKQRKREKELREEAKKKEADTSGEATFKVRGPPWARKIVKVENPSRK